MVVLGGVARGWTHTLKNPQSPQRPENPESPKPSTTTPGSAVNPQTMPTLDPTIPNPEPRRRTANRPTSQNTNELKRLSPATAQSQDLNFNRPQTHNGHTSGRTSGTHPGSDGSLGFVVSDMRGEVKPSARTLSPTAPPTLTALGSQGPRVRGSEVQGPKEQCCAAGMEDMILGKLLRPEAASPGFGGDSSFPVQFWVHQRFGSFPVRQDPARLPGPKMSTRSRRGSASAWFHR